MIEISKTAQTGNICATPNGTAVKRSALGYCKVDRSGKITNNTKWYVEHDKQFEVWQHEVKDKNGDYYIKTVLVPLKTLPR